MARDNWPYTRCERVCCNEKGYSWNDGDSLRYFKKSEKRDEAKISKSKKENEKKKKPST